MILIVSLWVAPDRLERYFAFERAAAKVMAKHGGRIERVIRPLPDAASDPPFEVHIVSFPDAAAFDGYRTDPETQALARTRSAVILRTAILTGTEEEPYA